MASVKMLAKGQVVIPANTRKRYKIKQGSRLELLEYENIIYLIPPVDNPIASACGFLPKKPSLSSDLLREQKKDYR